MRLKARFAFSIAVLGAAAACAASLAFSQTGNQDQQTGSQTPQTANQQQTAGQAAATGAYVTIDPLARVRYDNRYDLSLGMAYDHMKAGPTLLQGANLGGLDMEGSYWLTRHWGIQASGRGYLGTAVPSPSGQPYLKGAVVKQYFFVGGLEALGPHNKHGAIIAHAMFGGVYGNFEKDLLGQPAGGYDFYHNQVAPAGIIGGHFDLNRSERWVFRVTPDAVMTHYNYSNTTSSSSVSFSRYDVNFAISVGVEYKFTSIKRSTQKANWKSGW